MDLTPQDIERLKHHVGGKQAFYIGEETRSLERAGLLKIEPLSNTTLVTTTDKDCRLSKIGTLQGSNRYVPNAAYTQEDWDEVSDNPELTDEEMAQGRPLGEVMPGLVAAVRRHRGPQKTPTKAQVSLRVDRDVLDALRPPDRDGRGG